MASIFTKIIQGEIPCYKIYEDEWTFVLLAKDQVQWGHTLVVPKIEIDYFVDVPEPYYSAVFKVSQKIAKAIKVATQCQRVVTTVIGYEVPHFHYHLVPTQKMADFNWSLAKTLSPEKMIEIQEKIKSALKL